MQSGGYLRHPYCPECHGGKKTPNEGERIKAIGESLGWANIHGGPEDGGLYWRGMPPGHKGLMQPCPDWLGKDAPAEPAEPEFKTNA